MIVPSFTSETVLALIGVALLSCAVAQDDEDFRRGIGTYDEAQLTRDLFDKQGYNPMIRPVRNLTDMVEIKVGLALLQVLHIDERNQVMKVNVWVQLTWTDVQLQWNPEDYHGIRVIRVPAKRIWRPDIVLMNNADGKYEQTYEPKAVVYSYGAITYIPPAIYKSSCTIDVKWFPFDEQICELKFGSWTYNGNELKYGWYDQNTAAVMQDYLKSGTWDILSCPGRIINETGPDADSPPVKLVIFSLRIRRKTLFFMVNLIIPCILLAILCVCVFYLPADAGEKITLSTSLLFAINVFLLLVYKILPPTSRTVPLVSRYLMFTSSMNIISMVITVINININFRGPKTHRMPQVVRVLFIEKMPKILFMKQPAHLVAEEQEAYLRRKRAANILINGGLNLFFAPIATVKQQDLIQPDFFQSTARSRTASVRHRDRTEADHCRECAIEMKQLQLRNSFRLAAPHSFQGATAAEASLPRSPLLSQPCTACSCSSRPGAANASHPHNSRNTLAVDSSQRATGAQIQSIQNPVSTELQQAIGDIIYVAEMRRLAEEDKMVRQEWKFIGAVLDRILLIAFVMATVFGTTISFFSAPNVFTYIDQDEIIRQMTNDYKDKPVT